MTRRTIPFLLLAVVALAATAVAPAPVAAQAQYELPLKGKGPDTRPPAAQAAIDKLRSPYCPELMLEVCPSSGGAALRDSIETLARQGWSSDSIVSWVLARHGKQWLALPPARGTGLLAWVTPGLALLLGIVVVTLVLRAARARRPAPVRDRELSEEEDERLREAMREMEAEEEAPL